MLKINQGSNKKISEKKQVAGNGKGWVFLFTDQHWNGSTDRNPRDPHLTLFFYIRNAVLWIKLVFLYNH